MFIFLALAISFISAIYLWMKRSKKKQPNREPFIGKCCAFFLMEKFNKNEVARLKTQTKMENWEGDIKWILKLKLWPRLVCFISFCSVCFCCFAFGIFRCYSQSILCLCTPKMSNNNAAHNLISLTITKRCITASQFQLDVNSTIRIELQVRSFEVSFLFRFNIQLFGKYNEFIWCGACFHCLPPLFRYLSVQFKMIVT